MTSPNHHKNKKNLKFSENLKKRPSYDTNSKFGKTSQLEICKRINGLPSRSRCSNEHHMRPSCQFSPARQLTAKRLSQTRRAHFLRFVRSQTHIHTKLSSIIASFDIDLHTVQRNCVEQQLGPGEPLFLGKLTTFWSVGEPHPQARSAN